MYTNSEGLPGIILNSVETYFVRSKVGIKWYRFNHSAIFYFERIMKVCNNFSKLIVLVQVKKCILSTTKRVDDIYKQIRVLLKMTPTTPSLHL